MATGIIAIAAKQQRHRLARRALYLDRRGRATSCSSCCIVAAARPRTTSRLVDDLTSHAEGLRVPHHRRRHQRARQRLGTRSTDGGTSPWILWWCQPRRFGSCSLYATLIAVVLRHDKPGLGAGINGTWFLLTVSTESIAVLGALLLGRSRQRPPRVRRASPRSCLGIVLYLIVMTMVFLRWTFQPLEPTEADPPAWIAAGAVAITVLAGSNLLARPCGVAPRRAARPVHRRDSSRWPGRRRRSGSRS